MTRDETGPVERTEWVLALDHLERDDAEAVCHAVLDLLRPRVVRAFVDAWSDYRDRLPASVLDAQERLRELGVARQGNDSAMAIPIDAQDPGEWRLLRTYAAWSIHVVLWEDAAAARELATFHDCGYDVGACLTATEADQLAQWIGDAVHMRPLQDILDERRRRRPWPWRHLRRRRRTDLK